MSVDEYVQLNLHLLKRDFLESIIVGIQNFFESKNQSEISVDSQISIYPNSRVVQVEKFLAVNFNFKKATEKLSGINLKKEFAYGQLLCLTSSADLTDLIVARVVRTDENLISKGSVKVEIVRTENIENPLRRNYIMFVCKSFAELYIHNFITIQNLHKFNYPFAEYFLKVKVRYLILILFKFDFNHSTPSYRRSKKVRTIYQISQITGQAKLNHTWKWVSLKHSNQV